MQEKTWLCWTFLLKFWRPSWSTPGTQFQSPNFIDVAWLIVCHNCVLGRRKTDCCEDYFESQVNRLSWKKRCWLPSTTIFDNVTLKEPQPFVYANSCDVEDEIKTMMFEFLVSSSSVENGVQHSLRLAMAVLMNIEELVIEDTFQKDFCGLVQLKEGLFESYTDPESRKRFLKIAGLLVETALYVSGPELRYVAWHPEQCADGLPLAPEDDWSSPWTKDTFHGLNLDWALATAVMVNNKAALNAILKATRTFDGYVILSNAIDLSNFLTAADINWKYDDRGPAWANALAVAVRKGDYELATLLMDNCIYLVNAYTTVPPHESALEIACQQGSLQMVDMILDPCRGLDYTSWHAFYAVQMAARCSCTRDGLANCEERLFIICLLLDLQSPERDCQKLKNEVLRQACKWGCMTLVRALIEDMGAEPANMRDAALGCAATHGHVEVMEYLLNCDPKHLSLFFAVYSIEFNEAAADLGMMRYLEGSKASILADGPLEPVKAQYLLSAAKARACPKVVDLLTRGGVHD